MSRPFSRRRSGEVAVRLSAPERELLARLLADVGSLLDDPPVPAEPERPAGPAGGPDGSPDGVDWAGLEAAVSVSAPEDPAVARLLPDASRDDPQVAEGFRRLTEQGLRERKRSGLTRASAALGRPDPVVLDDEEARALLKGLTDVRLVVAERLGLRTDEDAELLHRVLSTPASPGEPEEWRTGAAVYDALTWWQESLVAALMPSRRRPDRR